MPFLRDASVGWGVSVASCETVSSIAHQILFKVLHTPRSSRSCLDLSHTQPGAAHVAHSSEHNASVSVDLRRHSPLLCLAALPVFTCTMRQTPTYCCASLPALPGTMLQMR
jgi:hypothetical protein